MLIFLDIDGVMVPTKSWERPELLNDGFPKFSSNAISVLQYIISDDTTIMLTTSHKFRFSISEWINIFKKRTIEIKNIKTLKKSEIGISRKDEILNWFNSNQINEDFIIIDDDTSLNDLPSYLKDHLILTSSMIGLTESHLSLIESKTRKITNF